jgi:pimeloyl-ACP methyl ester carboxylesterase
MKIVDLGSGTPLVLVPGIQGRWEWMRPAVDALARRCRVVTFSLADEPTCGWAFDEADGFGAYIDQVRQALDARGIREAAVCGVSFGGLIAARFAQRYPQRVQSLILASAIPPHWTPDRRVRFFLRAPWALSPLFLVGSLRMFPEIAAANAGYAAAAGPALRHAINALTHMFSPGRMARRVHMLEPLDLTDGLDRVNVPTLVMTGEPGLDRVVPVALTKDYLRIWPHAEYVMLERTGHLGLITRPPQFADAVVGFMGRAARHSAERKIG